MNKINNLILEMFIFDAGEPELIQHFIKVHEFANLIGNMENVMVSFRKRKNLFVHRNY